MFIGTLAKYGEKGDPDVVGCFEGCDPKAQACPMFYIFLEIVVLI